MNRGITIAPLFLVLLLAGMCSFYFFGKYTRLTKGKVILVLLGSLIAAGAQIFYRLEATQRLMNHQNEERLIAAAIGAGLFVPLAAAFVLRLWACWVGGQATPAEQQPGAEGVRAWFSASNVSVGLMLVLCAWLGHDVPLLFGAVSAGALLAAAPLVRAETTGAAGAVASEPAGSAPFSVVPNREDLSPEREKIVAMLEAGKLTPEESADLLQALGDSSRAASQTRQQVPLTSGQRLMLIGAALVMLGFFLPWIVVNPGKEATRMMGQFQVNMSMNMPGVGLETIKPNMTTPTVSYSGGDIQRGLGWAALALALAAAILPYVATTLDIATVRTVRMLSLGIGGIIVLYLLTQNVRFIGIGLVLAVGGYVVEAVGALRERRHC